MSTAHENTESIFRLFRVLKLDISDAIKDLFPFLEVLRDNNVISNKQYDDFQESHGNLIHVQKVVYKVLKELEEKNDLEALGFLFCKHNMKAYPDLEHIFKRFKNVLPQNEFWSEEIDRRDQNSQLSVEQGPGDSCSQESLTWLPSGPSSSDGWRSTQGTQTENRQFSIPQNHSGLTDPRQSNVDFNRPELPVTCGSAKGTLYVEKFKKGTHEKSIRTETGEWLTLRKFEIRGDHEKSKNWKKSIHCYGCTLGYLIEKGSLPNSPMMKGKARRPGMCGNDNRVHERPTQGYAGSTPSVLHTTEERRLSRPPGAHADKQNQEQAELEGIPLSTFGGEHAPHLSEPQHPHINSKLNNPEVTVGIQSAKTLKRKFSTNDTN